MGERLPSYRLKLTRANKHLEQIDDLIAHVNEAKPYEVREAVEVDRKTGQRKWVYNLWTTDMTDAEEVATVLIGDFLYNVRSALDHLAVALAPNSQKWRASFPVMTEPISETRPDACDKCKRDPGNPWLTATKGMDPDAVAILKRLQPGEGPHPVVRGQQTTAKHALLYLLSSLNNMDKHREALPIEWHFKVPLVLTNGKPLLPDNPGHTFENGAEIMTTYEAVDVKVDPGFVLGLINKDETYYDASQTCRDILTYTALDVIDPLERFVKR